MNIWNSIKNILKNKNENQWTPDKDAVYFHEDSFCQVEFIPRENMFYLKKENEDVNQFATEHFDGLGYTDAYARDENPIKIIDKKIVFDKIDNILIELGLEKIVQVYSGYGSTSWKCENTFVYRIEEAEIFISTEGEIIKDFWIEGFRFFEDYEIKNKLKKILLTIGNEYDLLLNDWNITVVVDLKKETQIENYLNEEPLNS